MRSAWWNSIVRSLGVSTKPWIRNVWKQLFGFEDRLNKRYNLRHFYRPQFEALEDRYAPATFVEAGALLNLDMNVAAKTVGIVSNGATYSLTLTGDTWSGINSANVTGNGLATLTVTAAGLAAFDTVNLTDSAAGSGVDFNNSGANAYSDHFNVTLSDAPGTITFNGSSSFTLGNSINATTSRNIQFLTGSLTTVDGAITLSANQQGFPTAGSFVGILVNGGTVQATGTGVVTVQGKGGDSSASIQIGVLIQGGGDIIGGTSGLLTVQGTGGASFGSVNHGVYVEGAGSSITSIGSNVSVSGTGGGAGGSSDNYGVNVENGGVITAGVNGTVTVVGQGGTGTAGSLNIGVRVSDNSAITSNAGSVSVIGTGGGTGVSTSNIGVELGYSGRITANGSGSVTVAGVGGNLAGTGGFNAGVRTYLFGTITSSGGNVVVTGTEGGAASSVAFDVLANGVFTTATFGGTVTLIGDSMSFANTAIISAQAASSVTLRQRTNGVGINLGAATDPNGGPLSLTDAELDRVTAGTVNIGNANTGTITVSAAISHGNNLSLTTGADIQANQATTMASDKNLTALAVGTISLGGGVSDLAATGTGTISLTTQRNILLGSGASVSTVNGSVTLSANQQVTPTAGNFIGINVIDATIQATGTGAVTVQGRGGDFSDVMHGVIVQGGGDIIGGTSGILTVQGTGGASFGDVNYGVGVTDAGSSITSIGSNVSVTGTGGGAGGSSDNGGVFIANGGVITAGVNGTVTVVGQGGTGSAGSSNLGVWVSDTNSAITSNAGSVSVIGTGGGTGVSTSNVGVGIGYSGRITAGGSGSVSVAGVGGNLAGTGGFNAGVQAVFGGTITSSGGNVVVTGTEGGAASSVALEVLTNAAFTTATNGGTVTLIGDSMNFANTAIISAQAASSVTLRQRTNGVGINLGAATDAVGGPLSLTDAELDRVTAGTLNIGNADTGTITISNVISPLNYKTLNLAKGVNFASSSGFASDVTSATVFEKIRANGAVSFHPSASLTVTAIGGFVPAASDSFMLLENTSVSTTTGDFSGKSEGTNVPVGGVNKRITYIGGTNSNDVVLTPAAAVNLSVSANTGTEAGTTVITVTATASEAVSGNQTVNLAVTGTNITAGDFTLSNNTITILDGQTQGSVTFTVKDDLLNEGNETATLTISSPSAGIALGTTISQNITITDDDNAGSSNFKLPVAGVYRIVLNGGNVEIRDSANVVVASRPLGTAPINITGTAGDDTLIVDFVTGDPIPTGGISFNGGVGANDKLAVRGTGTQSAVYTPDALVTGSGVVTVGTKSINFTGLEPVDIFGMLNATLMMPLTGANDTLTITNGFNLTAAPGPVGTIPALVVAGTTGDTAFGAGDGVTIETVAFLNNTNVFINTTATDGDDRITIVSANNAHGNTNVTINTGAGADNLIVNGAVNVAGTFTATTPTVNLNNNITAATITGSATTVNVNNTTAQIQDGIDVAASGATVNIAAGTFAESVLLNKGVTLDGVGVTTIIDPVAGHGISVTANNATIRDLRVTGAVADGINASGVSNLTLTNIQADTNGDDGIDLSTITGLGTLSNIIANSNGDDGFIGASLNTAGTVTIQNSTFNSNVSVGIELSNVGAVTTTSVTATGNDLGVLIATADSYTDVDGVYTGNVNHGIRLTDIAGLVSLTRTTANDNDANNGGLGDGVNMTDGADAGTDAIGSLLVVGGSFSDTAAAGGQRFGIRVGNGVGGIIHSVNSTVTFQSDVGAGALQHVAVTGNLDGGVEIEDGGTTASFAGNGNYSGNAGTGVTVASLSSTFTVTAGSAFSNNTTNGIQLIDIAGLVSLTGTTLNDNGGDGLNASDGVDGDAFAVGGLTLSGVTITETGAGNVQDRGVFVGDSNGAVTFNDNGAVQNTINNNTQGGVVIGNVTGNVSITSTNGATYSSNTGGDGINIASLTGSLTVTGVAASSNAGDGLDIGDGGTTAGISTSTFSSNTAGSGVKLNNGAGSFSGGVTLTNVIASSNSIDGVNAINVNGTTTVTGGTFNSNGSDGIELSNVGAVTTTSVTATGNNRGVLINGAASYADVDGVYTGNDNHGIQLIDIAGLVGLTRTTANDNDANNGGLGDGVNMTDGADAGTDAIGSLLVIGGSFSDTAAAGGQRFGIRVGNGVGGTVHSVGTTVTFQSDVGVSALQHVTVTGNLDGGVEIEDGGTTASFAGNGNYSGNAGAGVTVASLSSTFTATAGSAFSNNTTHGINLIDITGAVSVTGITANDNGLNGLNAVDGADAGVTAIGGLTVSGSTFTETVAGNTQAFGVFTGEIGGDVLFNDNGATVNTVTGNTFAGVHLSAVTGTATFTTVAGPTGSTYSSNGGNGVQISAAGTTVAFTNGTFSNNATNGISLVGGTGGVTLTNVTANSNSIDGVFATSLNATTTVTGGTFNSNTDDGLDLDGNGAGTNLVVNLGTGNTANLNSDDGLVGTDFTAGVSVTSWTFNNNGATSATGDGIDLSNVGAVTTTSVTATGNDPGVLINGAASYADVDGVYTGNDNHGIRLIDITGLVSLTRTTANDNDANNGGLGDGVNMTDGADAGTEAIGSLLVIGGSFSDTAAAGAQRFGIRVGDGIGGTVHSVGTTVTFQSDGAVGALQHVSVTGNQNSGVEIEDGGTTASFAGNGNYSGNAGTGVTVASLSGTFTVTAGNAFSNNTSHGIILIDIDGLASLTGATLNDNGGDGLNAVDGGDGDFFAVGGLTLSGVTITETGAGNVQDRGVSVGDSNGAVTFNDNGAVQNTINNNTQGGVVIGNVTGNVSITSTNAATYSSNTGGDGINIASLTGTLTVSGITASSNAGDGLDIGDGGTTGAISTSAFSSNTAGSGIRLNSAGGNFTGAVTMTTVTANSNSVDGINVTNIAGLGLNGVTANLNTGEGLDANVAGVANTITNSQFNNNARGMLLSGVGTVSVDASTFNNNTVTGNGAGISTSNGTLQLTNVTVSGNTANGGGAQGGGIQYTGGTGHTITRSTIDTNTAAGGGAGINLAAGLVGTVNVTNSTISTNTGNGINVAAGILSLQFATIARNTNTGLRNAAAVGNVLTQNTIFAENTVFDYDGNFTSLGNNLFQNPAGFPPANLAGSDIQNQLARLAPLSLAYGGTTRTHALLPGSAALNAGAPVAGITTDQRGVAGSRNVTATNPAPDIGAFESQGFTIVRIAVPNGAGTNATPAGDTAFRGLINQTFVNPDGSTPLQFAVQVTAIDTGLANLTGGVVNFIAPALALASAVPLAGQTVALTAAGTAQTTAAANNVASAAASNYAFIATLAANATVAAPGPNFVDWRLFNQKVATVSYAAAGFITGISGSAPNDVIITTSSPHMLLTGQRVIISGVTANPAANGSHIVTFVSPTQFMLNGVLGNGAAVSGGIFAAAPAPSTTIDTIASPVNSPIVITKAGHGLISGQQVTVSGVAGMTSANDTWTINVLSPNAFELLGSRGNAPYVAGTGSYVASFGLAPQNLTSGNLVNFKNIGGALSSEYHVTLFDQDNNARPVILDGQKVSMQALMGGMATGSFNTLTSATGLLPGTTDTITERGIITLSNTRIFESTLPAPYRLNALYMNPDAVVPDIASHSSQFNIVPSQFTIQGGNFAGAGQNVLTVLIVNSARGQIRLVVKPDTTETGLGTNQLRVQAFDFVSATSNTLATGYNGPVNLVFSVAVSIGGNPQTPAFTPITRLMTNGELFLNDVVTAPTNAFTVTVDFTLSDFAGTASVFFDTTQIGAGQFVRSNAGRQRGR